MKTLKHKPQRVAAQQGACGFVQAIDADAIEGNLASVRGVNQPAQIQQRAFAAA